jgi:LCP family protein required for cell wall assembly
VATLNIPERRAALLSIPRDSRVRIPGRGVDRINAAYSHGGAPLARAAAEDLLGRRIDYYMKTDFNGFQKIVDAMGGIEVDVEKRMFYRDGAQNLTIDLRPGKQVLNGHDAMGYVRFRHDAMGDIGRIERQQKFVHAVFSRMMSPAALPRLPFILNEMRDCVTTDIPARDFLILAKLGKGLCQSNLTTEMVPGRPVMIGGKSFWEVDRHETARVLSSMDRQMREPDGERDGGRDASPVSVCVLNGCGVPGAASKVAERLVAAGFTVTRTGNADTFGYTDSRIIDTSRDNRKGERVRRAIGCGGLANDSSLRDSQADVTVILGKDYGRI